MPSERYVCLIEVHFRHAIFLRGQELSVDEMGPYAYSLIRFGLVRNVEVAAPLPLVA
jgi:hypothetical protein